MGGIGFLGGTFDPPHIGHLLLAETALLALDLEQVIFLPVGQPTHKTTMTAADHRLAMTRLAVMGDERLMVDEVDMRREPPHYTLHLLPLLEARWPNHDRFLLLGGDSIADLITWHRPLEILSRIRGVGLARPGSPIDWSALENDLPGVQSAITMIDGPSIAVSSTAIREAARGGQLSRYLLPAAVRDYIARHQLYQSTSAPSAGKE